MVIVIAIMAVIVIYSIIFSKMVKLLSIIMALSIMVIITKLSIMVIIKAI